MDWPSKGKSFECKYKKKQKKAEGAAYKYHK